MTCEKCYHNEVCTALYELNGIPRIGATECAYFRDKDRLIEAPCAVGDKIYRLDDLVWNSDCDECKHFEEGWYDCPSKCNKTNSAKKHPKCIEIREDIATREEILYLMQSDLFGKTAFFSREEAEKAIAELEAKYEK